MSIDYQYVAIPPKLYNCLDKNCRSVLYCLIQLSSYYAKEDEDYYFYRTNDDLTKQADLSKNTMDTALDALYINGIIDVIPCEKGQGKKQIGKRLKVYFESFKRFEKLSFEDTFKNSEYRIETVDYKKSRVRSFQLKLTSLPTSSPTSSQSDNNINNIDNITNIENIDLIYNKLIENRDRIIEEGLDKFDYELYSDSSMTFLDDHATELFNSYKYFNSDEFDGKQKFYELVSSDSSIGYEEIEQLFKYCIRTQAARTSTEEMVSVSSAPAPCPVQTEEEFLSALFDKMDKLISAPQQECGDYMELVDDCVMYYGWKREQATVFVGKLLSASKNCFMNIT